MHLNRVDTVLNIQHRRIIKLVSIRSTLILNNDLILIIRLLIISLQAHSRLGPYGRQRLIYLSMNLIQFQPAAALLAIRCMHSHLGLLRVLARPFPPRIPYLLLERALDNLCAKWLGIIDDQFAPGYSVRIALAAWLRIVGILGHDSPVRVLLNRPIRCQYVLALLRKLNPLLLLPPLARHLHGVVGPVGHADVGNARTSQACLRVHIRHAIVSNPLLFLEVHVLVFGSLENNYLRLVRSLKLSCHLLLQCLLILLILLFEYFVAEWTLVVIRVDFRLLVFVAI